MSTLIICIELILLACAIVVIYYLNSKLGMVQANLDEANNVNENLANFVEYKKTEIALLNENLDRLNEELESERSMERLWRNRANLAWQAGYIFPVVQTVPAYKTFGSEAFEVEEEETDGQAQ